MEVCNSSMIINVVTAISDNSTSPSGLSRDEIVTFTQLICPLSTGESILAALDQGVRLGVFNVDYESLPVLYCVNLGMVRRNPSNIRYYPANACGLGNAPKTCAQPQNCACLAGPLFD